MNNIIFRKNAISVLMRNACQQAVYIVQYLPLVRMRLSVRLAFDTPDPKRQRFESSLTSEATPVKVNVSYAAFFYTQVLGHRLQ